MNDDVNAALLLDQEPQIFGEGLCLCGCGERPSAPKWKYLHGHGTRIPARQRFEKYLKRDETTGCLLWMGHRDKRTGYGRFYINGLLQKPHRITFVNAGGALTEDRPHVLHKCDNPPCCEPSHLFAGNNAENAADKAKKGRGRKSTKLFLPYGVYPSGTLFGAHVRVNNKLVRLGSYKTAEEAHEIAIRFKATCR